jgi:hypothetical protein
MGFGHAEKKPTAVLASTGITFAKYNGFSQKSPNFADGTHSAKSCAWWKAVVTQ